LSGSLFSILSLLDTGDDDGDDVTVGHCPSLLKRNHIDTYSTDSHALNKSKYFSHLDHLYIESGLYIGTVFWVRQTGVCHGISVDCRLNNDRIEYQPTDVLYCSD